jgi:hypothetical protein
MRIYGCWAGNSRGTEEDPTRCTAEVPEGGRSPLFHQCNKKRGHGPDGLYCKQHANLLAKGRYVSVPKEDL